MLACRRSCESPGRPKRSNRLQGTGHKADYPVRHVRHVLALLITKALGLNLIAFRQGPCTVRAETAMGRLQPRSWNPHRTGRFENAGVSVTIGCARCATGTCRARVAARSGRQAAESDQAVPAVIGVEHGQVAPGLEIAEITRSLVAEGAAAILRELARQVGDLLVAAVVLDREVQGRVAWPNRGPTGCRRAWPSWFDHRRSA